MDIRTLRYFVEVVRQQSFTRAAEKLFVTQPTISKMLKNLEDELNCTLLIRDGRKLLLTDTGRVVLNAAGDPRRVQPAGVRAERYQSPA